MTASNYEYRGLLKNWECHVAKYDLDWVVIAMDPKVSSLAGWCVRGSMGRWVGGPVGRCRRGRQQHPSPAPPEAIPQPLVRLDRWGQQRQWRPVTIPFLPSAGDPIPRLLVPASQVPRTRPQYAGPRRTHREKRECFQIKGIQRHHLCDPSPSAMPVAPCRAIHTTKGSTDAGNTCPYPNHLSLSLSFPCLIPSHAHRRRHVRSLPCRTVNIKLIFRLTARLRPGNKFNAMVDILQTGRDVVFSDPDNVWAADPFKEEGFGGLGAMMRSDRYDLLYSVNFLPENGQDNAEARAKSKREAAFLADGQEAFYEKRGTMGNTGMYWIRSTPQAIAMLNYTVSECAGNTGWDDQTHLWQNVLKSIKQGKLPAPHFKSTDHCTKKGWDSPKPEQHPVAAATAQVPLRYCHLNLDHYVTGRNVYVTFGLVFSNFFTLF